MGGKAKRKQPTGIETPTPEQQARAGFELQDVVDKQANGRSIAIGKAYRRIPMIDTLRAQGILSFAEHKALKHYRHHADVADSSPTRDSLANAACPIRGRFGDGPGPTRLHAERVRNDCERAAGSLVDILRAVVVYDQSLSEWAMSVAGAVEQWRDRGGKRVCTMEPLKGALATARIEIQIAAQRVQAELDA